MTSFHGPRKTFLNSLLKPHLENPQFTAKQKLQKKTFHFLILFSIVSTHSNYINNIQLLHRTTLQKNILPSKHFPQLYIKWPTYGWLNLHPFILTIRLNIKK